MTEIAITASQARELTDRIKVGVEAIWELVKQAYQARAWVALGYDSWDDYCTREFGTSRIRLPREERQEVVASMREIGMSTRAISAATGADRNTVRSDLRQVDEIHPPEPGPVTGTDGKTYTPRPQPQSEPEEPELPQATALPQSDLDELNAEPPTWQPAGHLRDTDLNDLKKEKTQHDQPRSEAITNQFTSAISDLTRVANRFRRIADDKNFPRNKEKVAAMHRHDLNRLIGELQTIADEIN